MMDGVPRATAWTVCHVQRHGRCATCNGMDTRGRLILDVRGGWPSCKHTDRYTALRKGEFTPALAEFIRTGSGSA
jgi:hypothetical protein